MHLIPLLALYVGVGAVVLGDLLARLVRPAVPVWRRGGLTVAALLATAVIGAELVGRYRDYFGDYHRRADVLGYFQYGLEQAVAYALAHEAEYDEVWLAGGNQFYMYLLFYGRWPPSEVQRGLRLRRSPGDFNDVQAIGKYRFGSPSAAPVAGLPLLQTLRDPNGLPTCEIRAGENTTGERVLVISHLAS